MIIKQIPCACGCGEMIPLKDKNGRTHKFVNHHHRNGIICPKEEYDNRRGKFAYQWKGGKVMGSDGYYLIRTKNGYIREHRLIYEKYNKCCLLGWAVIHHLNGIKTDNRIENLEPIINNGIHHLLHHEHKRDLKTGRFIRLAQTHR